MSPMVGHQILDLEVQGPTLLQSINTMLSFPFITLLRGRILRSVQQFYKGRLYRVENEEKEVPTPSYMYLNKI